MATLDAQDLAVLVAKSGWFPNDKNATQNINTAVAIALAESHGKTDAISATGDYGLWQINKNAHAGLFTKYKWDDPTDNARMAKEVWEAAGRSFKPWVTYNNGAYQKYMKPGAVIPKSDAPNSARDDAINAVKGTGNLLGGALSDVFKFVTQGFITIGAFLAALALLLLGAWWLVKDTDAGRKVKAGAEAAVVAGVTKGAV